MRTVFAMLLLVPVVGMGAEIRIACGMTYEEAAGLRA
jgi:hypothetical protein